VARLSGVPAYPTAVIASGQSLFLSSHSVLAKPWATS